MCAKFQLICHTESNAFGHIFRCNSSDFNCQKWINSWNYAIYSKLKWEVCVYLNVNRSNDIQCQTKSEWGERKKTSSCSSQQHWQVPAHTHAHTHAVVADVVRTASTVIMAQYVPCVCSLWKYKQVNTNTIVLISFDLNTQAQAQANAHTHTYKCDRARAFAFQLDFERNKKPSHADEANDW